MTPLQHKWTTFLAISIVALIVTSHFNQGIDWVFGWSLFGWFSLQKLACHGGLDLEVNEDELDNQ